MKKKFYNKIILLVLSILTGFLLAFQMKQNIDDYNLVSLKSIEMMKNEVNNNSKKIENLNILIYKRERDLEELEDVVKNKGDITEVLKEEINDVQLFSGYKDVEGPGILLIITDNQDKEVVGDDINSDVVHDVDMQLIVNDLRRAGAEAISINGQRVLSTSEIKCGGPIIRINDESVGTPFNVKAIGNPKYLSAAINAPGTYGYNLKNLYKLGVETIIKDNVFIERYKGEPEYKYAKPVKEGE